MASAEIDCGPVAIAISDRAWPLSHWLKILRNLLRSPLNISHGPGCELRDFSECPKFIGLHKKRLGGGEG